MNFCSLKDQAINSSSKEKTTRIEKTEDEIKEISKTNIKMVDDVEFF